MNRGDIVIADFPYSDQPGSKIRPALVVQSDLDDPLLGSTIVVMITSNTKHADRPSNLLIDPGTPDGSTSGLRAPSLAKCNNLLTIAKKRVHRVIGSLSPALMQQVDDCLKSALALT